MVGSRQASTWPGARTRSLPTTGTATIITHLRATYPQELQALSQTYADVRSCELHGLRCVVARSGSGPSSFVASGGMLAVATLAAQLHESACHEPAAAITPLSAVSRPALTSSAAMLFTSSGKHPDAREVMRRLGRPGMHPAAVLTHRPKAELPPLPEATVITLPTLAVPDGFLAVNSVMSMSVALIRAYLGDEVLPHELPASSAVDPLPETVDHLLLLYPPSLTAVAVDLEARLVEIGLATVQLADYRNFAHGRHTGLARNADRTTIVALSDHDSLPLADATVAALPASLTVARWHSEAPWPLSVLDLTGASMRACGELGERSAVNVARPKVPVFGRKLYRLPVRRRFPEMLLGPVERKLRGIGGVTVAEETRHDYALALARWAENLAERRFAAVVLDYDGTVCTTEERFEPPQQSVADLLNATLARGLRLGFASGRGPSMHSDLRAVLDPQHWSRVELGLYNGGVLCRLDEDLGDLRKPSSLIEQAVQRLRALPFAHALELSPRCTQLGVELADTAWIKAGLLADIVTDACRSAPALQVKVVSSGHSVDVVPATVSKTAVVERIRERDGPVDVLCVGDQGQIGGNDFEMLAGEQWTLSVDRTSSDPTRCWYLGDGSSAGPALLRRYLGALRGRRASATLKVSDLL
jgi:hydroxymethylpyrimidine pyrophosphatase-like HAD family hydrolase